MIPFLKIPVQRIIPKQVATSKTQELLTGKEMQILDKETSIPRSISEQYSAAKKEEWGKSFLYKLKSSQQVYSIQAFQNGRFALLEIPSRDKRFSLQDRSEKCLFLSATVCELKKVCNICLVGKALRLSLSLFWIRAGSQDIFKTIKGINSSIEVAEHSSSHISRRYSSDGKNIRGKFNEPRHIDFSASTSGFCHKPEKISSETITTNRVFRPKTRYPHHDFGNIRGNDRKGNFEMTESSFSPSNHCFGLTH